MKIKGPYLLFSLFFLPSCAFIQRLIEAPKEVPHTVHNEFRFKDESGQYHLLREAGPGKNNQTYVVKRKLRKFAKKSGRPLERSISISTKLRESKKLIPKISQYNVWFDKERHFSQIEMGEIGDKLKVVWESPDPKYNGVKYFPLEGDGESLCFFSQILECARHQGFLKKVTKDEDEKLKLRVIWDGYPFFQQQFPDFKTKISSYATLEFDGNNRKGHKRFSLKVEGETIFYFVDKGSRLMGLYWISKGLSMERIQSKVD